MLKANRTEIGLTKFLLATTSLAVVMGGGVASAQAANAAPAGASPAGTQQLEEVVVTATRRAERLQDVPIAVSVVTGEGIKEQGFADMVDVSKFTPNLIINNGFQGQTLQVRGIGTDPRNVAFEQAVAQFSDGIYYARNNMALSGLFDLERVEVVRGPQPVFAGMSATAGAINIISRKPGRTLDGNVSVEYGTDREMRLQGAVGGPISDTLAVRVAGNYYDLPYAGYHQVVTGEHIGARRDKAARVTALWTPSDKFDFTLKYEYQKTYQNGTPSEYGRCDTDLATSSGGPLAPKIGGGSLPASCAMESYLGLADLTTYNRQADSGGTVDVWSAIDFLNATRGTNLNTPIPRGLNKVEQFYHRQDRDMKANVVAGTFNYQIGQLTLTGISGLVSTRKEDWLDPDESAFALFTDQRGEKFRQLSQELRLASPQGKFLTWMVGAYYQTHKADLYINVYYPFVAGPPRPGMVALSPGGTLHETSDWASLFFTTNWKLTQTISINAGGRYQDSRKDGEYKIYESYLPAGGTSFGPRTRTSAPPLNASVNSHDFLPEVGAQWKPTEDYMFYGKYAEAFKAGGFVMNPPLGGVAPDPFTFLPEQAKGWEVGFKGTLFDRRLQLNVAYFDTKFTNLQVNSFNGSTARFEVRNAAASETKGIEIDGRFQAGRYVTIGFNAGTNDAKYTSFPNGQCGQIQARDWIAAGKSGTCVVDISGRPLGVPKWQFGLAPQATFPVGQYTAKVGLNGTWTAGVTSPVNPGDPLANRPGIYRIDLRASISSPRGNWEIAGYVRDLTDQASWIGGLQSAFFSTTTGTSNSDVHLYGVSGKTFDRGRRIGVQLTYFLGR